MKFSFEIPNILFDVNDLVNDYDFCLIHKYLTNNSYKQFFLNQKKKGRIVYLDNSAFELGEGFDINIMKNVIYELKPDYFFITDYYNDYDKTINELSKWKELIKEVSYFSKPIAVLQGKNIKELTYCYEYFIDNNIKTIGIPYGIKVFRNIEDNIEYIRRLEFLKKIKEENYDNTIQFHLLGCADYNEVLLLLKEKETYGNILSMDTSLPVCKGLYEYKDILFSPEKIIETKEYNEFIDKKENEINLYRKDMSINNCIKFKKINALYEKYKDREFYLGENWDKLTDEGKKEKINNYITNK